MSLGKNIIHLKYCRIVSEIEEYSFHFKSVPYKIVFASKFFDQEKGVIVENEEKGQIDIDLLLWLSVYFGEDFVDPLQEEDTRFCNTRGNFDFEPEKLNKFLSAAEKMPPKSFPKWKKKLFDKAITYYSAATRSGIDMMPLTIGLFGMTLECIGNIRHGKRDKHFTLGNNRFEELLKTRLKKYKLNDNYKKSARAFQKLVSQDIELIYKIRNAYYGHSLLHLQEDRQQLTAALRKWYIRSGHDVKFTNISFRVSCIENDIARESHGLYKVGLRTSRLFIFMLLGFITSIPFAEYDFKTFGDMRKGEVSKYRGIKFKVG